jgi:hypothetical protein
MFVNHTDRDFEGPVSLSVVIRLFETMVTVGQLAVLPRRADGASSMPNVGLVGTSCPKSTTKVGELLSRVDPGKTMAAEYAYARTTVNDFIKLGGEPSEMQGSREHSQSLVWKLLCLSVL